MPNDKPIYPGLRPCPWCGEACDIRLDTARSELAGSGYVAFCTADAGACNVRPVSDFHETPAECAEAWNHRA